MTKPREQATAPFQSRASRTMQCLRLKPPTWDSTRSESRVSRFRKRLFAKGARDHGKPKHRGVRFEPAFHDYGGAVANDSYPTTNSRTLLTTDSGASTSNSTNPSLYLRE